MELGAVSMFELFFGVLYRDLIRTMFCLPASSVSGPYRPITPYVKPFFTPQLCSQP